MSTGSEHKFTKCLGQIFCEKNQYEMGFIDEIM